MLKYCTNDLMHFGNTTTLHTEGGHSRIKRQLNNILTGMIALILCFFQTNNELIRTKVIWAV